MTDALIDWAVRHCQFTGGGVSLVSVHRCGTIIGTNEHWTWLTFWVDDEACHDDGSRKTPIPGERLYNGGERRMFMATMGGESGSISELVGGI